jgi:SAM-dependent methyltransferase
MKTYDREYFDRWYRHPTDRVATRHSLERKVRLAVSVAEFILARRIRSVLDIGCGEAPWFPVLRRLRSDVRYIGVESSEYAIARFGDSRNIRHGSIDDLGAMRLPRNIDLIVCADVLQYVDARGVERGLRAIRKLLGGVAYIETFTTDDAMEGDRDGWHERSAAEYRRLLRAARLTQCGPYCYLDRAAFTGLNDFEHC